MRKSQQISTFYTRRKNTSSDNICKVCKLLIQRLIRHLEIRPHCAAVYYNNNNNTNDKCKVAEKKSTNSRYTSTTTNTDFQDSNESHLVNDNSRKIKIQLLMLTLIQTRRKIITNKVIN